MTKVCNFFERERERDRERQRETERDRDWYMGAGWGVREAGWKITSPRLL